MAVALSLPGLKAGVSLACDDATERVTDCGRRRVGTFVGKVG